MPTKRSIRAKDVVRDIRDGMTDAELTEKYKISRAELRFLFEKLVALKAIGRAEAHGRLPQEETRPSQNSIGVESLRALPRHLAPFPIPIYDGKDPKVVGTLKDIHEKGVGIAEIAATVGETRTFVVLGDEFVAIEFNTFAFDAICRWTNAGEEASPALAGFEITNISPRDMTELRKLIRSLTMDDLPE
ncbi:MAG: PilZ domain-containing protein [Desulfomonile tiedjei]|nr:PilZ domain-containing protein [Desulfomonile tiedjei]